MADGSRRLGGVRSDRQPEQPRCRSGRRTTRATEPTMVFDAEIGVENDPKKELRGFWSGQGP